MQRATKKGKAPPVPLSNGQKPQWHSGATYVPKKQSFEEFAEENFTQGTPQSFVQKEIKRPILVYTPEKEKDDVVRVWRVLIRYMGDIVDYRSRMDFESHQPELGSVMTRICRQLGQNSAANPFGPPPAKLEGPLVPEGEGLQVLPTKPRLGTLRKLKNTIAMRLFGKGRKTVFHLLPLEETLLTDLDKIQYIIGYGILRPRIRDELYCGVCRQLINNPYKKSIEKGWILLNLMAACFTPTERCMDSILDFLDHGPKIFSASAKKLLQMTVATGGRIHPPSSLEYEAIKNRKPVELTIHLMDGTTFSFPADGTSSSGEICLAIANKVGVTNSFGFHLFITNRNKVSSLCLNDHIMDSVAQLEQIARDYSLSEEESSWELYYRKEVFAPWEEYSLDPVAANLVYAQVKRGVLLREHVCTNDDDFTRILAQICYVENGGTLDENFLQQFDVALQNDIIPQILWHMESPYMDQEDELEDLDYAERVEQFKVEMTQKVANAFEQLYVDAESKPNSFNVKLEVIEFARREFGQDYRRLYDITVIIDTGELMEGAMKIGIQNDCILLMAEDDLILEEVSFMDVLELGEEKNEDELHPHSVVLRLTGGRDLVCVSQDAADIQDMLTYILLGLIERSKYGVAITQNTATKVDDLDLELGDLLLLDRKSAQTKSSRHTNNNESLVRVKNKRTGQVGVIVESMVHILPTVREPQGNVLESYKNDAEQHQLDVAEDT